MNKILIVGHPLSGYEEVETLLNACGMATARPSRQEGFLPGEISTTLCKAHSTAPLQRIESDSDIQQIDAGPVWHGMALDLMLGNIDQPIWGWADPQAIHLLNYWRDLDPSITFILVYDKPHSVLTRTSHEDSASLTPQALAQRTRNWAAYNAALLHFFHRNPQRCLLVHTQQVRESASSYLQQVRARIDAPWPEQMARLAAPTQGDAEDAPSQDENTWYEPIDDQASDLTVPAVLVAADIDEARPPRQPAPIGQTNTPSRHPAPRDALMAFLADALVRQHPASLELYEELQAVATLPLADEAALPNQPLDAWLGMATQQLQLDEHARLAETQTAQIGNLQQRLKQTETLAEQKQQLVERLHQAQAEAEQLAEQRQRLIDEQTRLHHSQSQTNQQRLAGLQQALASVQQSQWQSQQENQELLAQLHQVQEALEQQHHDSQQQAQRAEQAQAQLAEARHRAERQAAELEQHAQILQRQMAELQQKAQTQAQQVHQSQADHQATQQECDLLLAQLHQVQEELERHFLESERQAQQVKALQKTELQATERQKQIEQLRQQLEAQTRQAAEANTRLSQLAQAKEAADKLAAERTRQLEQANKAKDLQTRQATEANAKAQQLSQAKAAADKLAAERAQELEKANKTKDEQAKRAASLDLQNEHLKKQLLNQTQQAQAQAAQLKVELDAAKARPGPNAELAQENELLLTQLHQVQEELERYYLENQRLKTNAPMPLRPAAAAAAEAVAPPSSRAVHYGAGQRIRQQLSYKLGATMLEHNRTLAGKLSLPWALLRVARQHRREKPEREAQGLPPINRYRDAHEAERFRNHLSYRLGRSLLDNAGSPIGWLRMPWSLRRQVHEFREYRRNQGR